MSKPKPKFPQTVWDGTAVDRGTRLIDSFPLYPSFDQAVSEIIALEEWAKSMNANLVYEGVADEELAPGEAVYINNNGRLSKAQNDLIIAPRVVGLILEGGGLGASCKYLTDGTLTLEDWSGVVGSITLSVGALYYLSNLPGKLTMTAPTLEGYYVIPIGRAVSQFVLDIEIGQAVRL